ncbi:MAG: hypothetical protein Q4B54_10410 [Coriobacteriales bacterium]|nr:hypothetical protein [Coriobacteriales bacterium]
MGVVEALVLLFSGLVTGILATVLDVLFVGACSFVSHVSLWVLINALIAVHLENRLHAIVWAIPFNLGYVEGYFITTVASFEGYSKSLVAPLAALAILSPFLTYAIWTAKNQRNAYGRILSLLIVAGTLGMCYVINRQISVYDGVVCALLALLLLVVPTRKLKISRAEHPVTEQSELWDENPYVAAPAPQAVPAHAAAKPSRRSGKRFTEPQPVAQRTPSKRGATTRTESTRAAAPRSTTRAESTRTATPRPTKRSKRVMDDSRSTRSSRNASSRRRMDEREAYDREMERSARRSRAQRRGTSEPKREPQPRRVATLGNARAAVTRNSLREM